MVKDKECIYEETRASNGYLGIKDLALGEV